MKLVSGAVLGLVAALTFAGCSSHHHHGMMGGDKGDAYWQKGQQDMAGLVDRTVKDPAKAKQVNAIVGEIINELRSGRDHQRAAHRQLYTLNASYDAKPEDFTKILDESNNQRMKTATTILGLRFKMKELMTADEWKTLSDKMLSYSSRYQHGGAGEKSGHGDKSGY